jgi:hypothetical protein
VKKNILKAFRDLTKTTGPIPMITPISTMLTIIGIPRQRRDTCSEQNGLIIIGLRPYLFPWVGVGVNKVLPL